MKLLAKQNVTGVKATIFAQDSSKTTGDGLAGLAFNTSGLTAYYYREGDASSTAITLATMTLGTWGTGGFIVCDGTNMKGIYQLGLPNACFTALGSVTIYLQGATNLAPVVLEYQVVAFDPTDAVRAGLTALPNVASGSAGAIPTTGTGANQLNVSGGIVDANAKQWLGTAVTAATAGIPDANVKNYNNQTATTDANNLPKVDVEDWRANAVPAANVNGVPLVDLKYTLGTISPAAAGYVGLDWGQVANKTTANALTGTTISTSQVAASVTAGVALTSGERTTLSGVIWDEVLTAATHNVVNSSGRDLRLINPNSDVIRTATAQAGGATTITLDAGANAVDQTYQWTIVSITSGTGSGQSRVITNYVGSTRVATVDTAWGTNPNNTSVFEITPSAKSTVIAYVAGQDPATLVLDVAASAHNVASSIGAKINSIAAAPSAASIATALWQDATSSADFTAAGSIGLLLATDINATIGSRSTYAGTDTSGITTLLSRIPGTVQPQTGDSFARLGAPAAASVSADILDIETDVNTLLAGVAVSSYAAGQDPATLVLDVAASGHNTAGTVGAKINSAGSAGDPWSTALPGAYTSGQAGNIIGNNLNAAITSRMATFTLPANFSSMALTGGGAVTVGTNSDKTGYALTQSFPTNFAALAISGGGGVTVTTNSDKTGYSLTQSFPANFATFAIGTDGFVSVNNNQVLRNTALNAFPFLMYDNVNHNPATGLAVAATRSLNGGAFAACANAVTEIGNGWYAINLAASDLNAATVALRFAAAGADDTAISIITQTA